MTFMSKENTTRCVDDDSSSQRRNESIETAAPQHSNQYTTVVQSQLKCSAVKRFIPTEMQRKTQTFFCELLYIHSATMLHAPFSNTSNVYIEAKFSRLEHIFIQVSSLKSFRKHLQNLDNLQTVHSAVTKLNFAKWLRSVEKLNNLSESFM